MINSGVKPLRITKEHGGVGIEPSEANIRSGRYPIARSLYLYTLDDAPSEVAAFVAFATGPTGQKLLKAEGFVSVVE
jgi:phosphate transport system substrate-binding protein